MTLKIPLYIIQTNFHRGEKFDYLAWLLLVKLALKIRCKIQLNWKRKTKELFNPLKGKWSAKIIKVHYPVNVLCMFKLGCVSTEYGESCLYMVGERGVYSFLWKLFLLVEAFFWCETWHSLKKWDNQYLDRLHLTTERIN